MRVEGRRDGRMVPWDSLYSEKRTLETNLQNSQPPGKWMTWEDIAQSSSPWGITVNTLHPFCVHSPYPDKDMLKHRSPSLVKIPWAFPSCGAGQGGAMPIRATGQEKTSHHLQKSKEPNNNNNNKTKEPNRTPLLKWHFTAGKVEDEWWHPEQTKPFCAWSVPSCASKLLAGLVCLSHTLFYDHTLVLLLTHASHHLKFSWPVRAFFLF